jgi:hypothetical protein
VDRRNALKKIAVGGATVVGASAVISSPAFAYDAPTSATAATLSAVRGNNRRVDMSVTGNGTTGCSGGSFTGTTQEYLDATATQIALTGSAFLQLSPFDGVNGPALPETTTAIAFNVRRVGNGSAPLDDNNFKVGDTFDVAVRVRHTCTYTGPGTGSRVFTTTFRIRWNGTNPQIVATTVA